ncbi:flavin prenyltransferase UbiX [Clostridium sp.]|uniref:UbiX family flavin prenyltransferase n=1 Tax=Clostridium sp. TaxID=1506 RepID=UPI002FC66029
MKKIVVGITGASGSIYGKTLVEELLKKGIFVHVICTENGSRVMEYETGTVVGNWVKELNKQYKNIAVEDINNMFSSVASGSYKFHGVIIIPCSMGTLGEISNGITKNLLSRVADVAMKENRKLVIVPRESPFNAIHLENMLKLARLGVTIMPAAPGFYHKPTSVGDLVNFMVGKIFDHLEIDNDLFEKWQ